MVRVGSSTSVCFPLTVSSLSAARFESLTVVTGFEWVGTTVLDFNLVSGGFVCECVDYGGSLLLVSGSGVSVDDVQGRLRLLPFSPTHVPWVSCPPFDGSYPQGPGSSRSVLNRG